MLANFLIRKIYKFTYVAFCLKVRHFGVFFNKY